MHVDIVARPFGMAPCATALDRSAKASLAGLEPHRNHFDNPALAHYKIQEPTVHRKSVLSQQLLLYRSRLEREAVNLKVRRWSLPAAVSV